VKKKQWVELTLRASPPFQELLIGQLAALGFEGFLQEETACRCYASRRKWSPTTKRNLASTVARFEQEFPGQHFTWTSKIIDQKNWNEAWERSIGIVDATPRIIIKPTWRKLRKRDKGKIVLHIDPKMAFGTGHHETTRLSLTFLEEHVRKGFQVLDFGSGTGILAIAAVKLGAASALAIDNDPWAVENSIENIRHNKVPGKVKAIEGDARKNPARQFDLIVANIDLPTISKSLKLLVRRLKPQAVLILSGLLASDLTQFMDTLTHQGVVPLEMINENEWVSLALIKADAISDH
jgi:ribosomal protein L11 methyltransferase